MADTSFDIDAIAAFLMGTPNSIEQAIEHFSLDIDSSELEDKLSDTNIERCPHCDWWYESGELVDEFDEVVGCRDCRS